MLFRDHINVRDQKKRNQTQLFLNMILLKPRECNTNHQFLIIIEHHILLWWIQPGFLLADCNTRNLKGTHQYCEEFDCCNVTSWASPSRQFVAYQSTKIRPGQRSMLVGRAWNFDPDLASRSFKIIYIWLGPSSQSHKYRSIRPEFCLLFLTLLNFYFPEATVSYSP